MTATRPDISLNPHMFIDVYAQQKIPPGTRTVIQNKSVMAVYVQLQPQGHPPPDTSMNGAYLRPYEYLELRPDSGEVAWVRSLGILARITLQVK